MTKKLVNVLAKMALKVQGVINVHQDFSNISTNASHVVALTKDQPQKFVNLKMANVHAKRALKA